MTVCLYFGFQNVRICQLEFLTQKCTLPQMLVKWPWRDSSCFSHLCAGCVCFIYAVMCMPYTDLLKLIKKPSVGCQIWARAFLCNLLYQIQNLWQSRMLPNFKWSVQSEFNKLWNSASFRVTHVLGSARARELMGTELPPSKSCLPSGSFPESLPGCHPAPLLFPIWGGCCPNSHGNAFDKSVHSFVQVGKPCMPYSMLGDVQRSVAYQTWVFLRKKKWFILFNSLFQMCFIIPSISPSVSCNSVPKSM